jgi:hypothetical protein
VEERDPLSQMTRSGTGSALLDCGVADASKADRITIGCTPKKDLGTIDDGRVRIIIRNSSDLVVAITPKDDPSQGFHFDLDAAILGKVLSMSAEIAVTEGVIKADSDLAFSSLVSILALAEESQINFGEVAVHQRQEKIVRLKLSGTFRAVMADSLTVEAPFAFKGGSFPGQGGSCAQQITDDCTLVLEFSPIAAGLFSTSLILNYDNGLEKTLLEVNLKGRGVLRADLILGQASASDSQINGGGATAYSFSSPVDIEISGGRMVVADNGNHRVLVWNTFPTSHGEAADLVLGQGAFVSGEANRGSQNSPGAATLYDPKGLGVDSKTLYVADTRNHRVLFYPLASLATGMNASLVLGQQDMNSRDINSGGISAASLDNPQDIVSTGTHIAVADRDNDRALLWNTIPQSDGAPADVVLRQGDMTENSGNSGLEGPTKYTLRGPSRLDVLENGSLAISDVDNHRVLIWNQWPIANSQSADLVIGQQDGTQGEANAGAATATADGLNSPRGMAGHNGGLFIVESWNHRVVRVPLP